MLILVIGKLKYKLKDKTHVFQDNNNFKKCFPTTTFRPESSERWGDTGTEVREPGRSGRHQVQGQCAQTASASESLYPGSLPYKEWPNTNKAPSHTTQTHTNNAIKRITNPTRTQQLLFSLTLTKLLHYSMYHLLLQLYNCFPQISEFKFYMLLKTLLKSFFKIIQTIFGPA